MSDEQKEDLIESEASSRDDLFRLLTEEIRDIVEAERLTGWTPWVVLASLISGAWVLVQDLWVASYSQEIIMCVFLLLTLTVGVAKSLRLVIDGLAADRHGPGVSSFLHSTASASHTLLQSTWALALALVCIRVARLNRTVFFAGSAYYFCLALALLTVTAAIVARLPMPVPTALQFRGPLGALLGKLLGLTALFLFDIAMIAALLRSGPIWHASITEIRIGGLLAFEVLGTLFISKRTSQFSDSRRILAEIRRDVVIGSAPTTELLYRARVALRGMFLSDVFTKDVSRLLTFTSQVRSEYDDALMKIQNLKDNVDISPARESLTIPAIDRLALGNTLDALRNNELRILEFASQYYVLLRSVHKRLIIVAALLTASQTERQKVLAEIEVAHVTADQMQQRFLREYFLLQDVWNRWFPSARRDYLPFGLVGSTSIPVSGKAH